MRCLLAILLFIPIFGFSQGNVKLLKVNGSSSPPLSLGNFSFTGDAMYISAVRAIYKNNDTLVIGLDGEELISFEAAIRLGDAAGVTSPGMLRFNSNEIQAYLDGAGWVNISNQSAVYKTEVQDDTKDTFNPGFTLKNTTVVMVNGVPLKDDQWAGEGTQTLTLTSPITKYDYLVIWK